MFGKKNKSLIHVCHYEGISTFSQDYPCTLEVKDDVIEIKRLKPEATVSLPLERVQQMDVMEEPQFMGKYHGSPVSTAKAGKKTFLVITYRAVARTDKYVAFWAAGSDAAKFHDLKMNFQKPMNNTILL